MNRIGGNDSKDILAKLEFALEGGWEIIEYEYNTVPHGYDGSHECIYIKIEDTDTIENKTGKPVEPENNHPFYYLWFAPLNWNGTIANGKNQGQDWTPGSVITIEYKIFLASDGDPSNMIDKIITEFNE